MARLRKTVEGDSHVATHSTNGAAPTDRAALPTTRQKHIHSSSAAEENNVKTATRVKQIDRSTSRPTGQVRLAPLKSLESLSDLTIQDDNPRKTRRKSPLKLEPRPLLQKLHRPREQATREAPIVQEDASNYETADESASEEKTQDEDSEPECSVEESIWCGSDAEASQSDSDLPSPSTFFPILRKKATRKAPDAKVKQLKALAMFEDDSDAPTSKPARPLHEAVCPMVRPGSSSDKENEVAILRFSPPRIKKPARSDCLDRPPTPPPSTSPSKLKSPSKRPPRVPTPPHRPSIDAFWTADTVNEWNDQYSPQKPLHSPAKKLFNDAPIPSPSKLSSPTKRTKSDVLARKEWETRKLDLAQAFLTELDDQITAGQISSLSASTGGVTIIWSKTLNTTAGRAKWRAETTKSHRSDPAVPPTVVTRHFASIELAEKVLTFGEDAETRLLNVIAHEFCHLANFMVSKVKDQPHGASFKAWGRKVSLAFAHRGIQVTTKHSYEIEYKYVWACRGDDCGLEYKRHSKSIDLDKHRCGVCKGELVQVKPVPRAGGATKGGGVAGGDAVSGKVNGYAGFMKQHFADLKKSMPGASHKEVMEALGKKYRAEKEAKGKPQQPASTTDMDDMADKLAKVQLQVREVINLD